ncbi:transcriptional repressor LexA [Canibacter zhoujuaniae]|uniref:transcriptional repressor LexA n=1 Tax=Canibacter zhoujuaniae TaxID=2708343 RepID=UPI001420F72F|nr:transcriptional repressor LexA [Canibacter zhoujuaniae]
MRQSDENKPLKKRTQAVLDYITEYVGAHGYAPSLREIGIHCDLNSLASVSHQIKVLEVGGYIRRAQGRSRALEIIDTEATADTTSNLTTKPQQRPTVDPAHNEQTSVALLRESFTMVPLLGQIAAGVPITAEEQVEDTMPLPKSLVGEGNIFMLRVVGDSMIDAAICNGDYVVIREQADAQNGEIVAAMLDGEATVKTFRRRDGHLWLLPQNSAYEPILGDTAQILGKVIAVFRAV